jgi:hypothetical protein
MSIVMPIAELKPALTGLSKALNRHSTPPVLNHIKIERTRVPFGSARESCSSGVQWLPGGRLRGRGRG